MSPKQTETVDAVLERVPALSAELDRVLDVLRTSGSCATAVDLQIHLADVERHLADALALARDLRSRADAIGVRLPPPKVEPPRPEPSPKLSTREVIDSRLLMIMISSEPRRTIDRAEQRRTIDRVIQSVEAELRGKCDDLPVYDVRVSINGVELDFRDFAKEVQRQFDDLVRRGIDEVLGAELETLVEGARSALQDLAAGVQQKAAELLGSKPPATE